MDPFNLAASVVKAEKRLVGAASRRRGQRSDRGQSRLHPALQAELTRLFADYDRPAFERVQERVAAVCAAQAIDPPARATLYGFAARAPAPSFVIASLPAPVRAALYNLDPAGEVPGHQLAFYCFNYGNLAAMSFAAGLPWLCLYQAARLRGFRPRSRGLLRAAMRARQL